MSLRNYRLIASVVLLFCGCSAAGHFLDYNEFSEADEALKVKSLKLRIEKCIYVNNIGLRLVKHFPRLSEGLYGNLGMLVSSLDKNMAVIFDRIDDEDKAIVYGLLKGSPAEKAGLKVGDVIFKINQMYVTSYNFGSVIANLKQDNPCRIEVLRKGDIASFEVNIGKIAHSVNFLIVDSQEVNAASFPGGVAITYGLLNFIKSDDELAIVLSHELAHFIKGHFLETKGSDLIPAILAQQLGKSADVSLDSELGKLLKLSFSSKVSFDLEREADFLGMLLAHKSGFDIDKGIYIWERLVVELPQGIETYFLLNHPMSSKRLFKLKKIAEDLKSSSLKMKDYFNPSQNSPDLKPE